MKNAADTNDHQTHCWNNYTRGDSNRDWLSKRDRGNDTNDAILFAPWPATLFFRRVFKYSVLRTSV